MKMHGETVKKNSAPHSSTFPDTPVSVIQPTCW